MAGPRNPWALREAYVPGSDDVRVGHQWVWTERTTYNPVGGLGDVYAVDIWRNLADPPIWNDPFTGIPKPFRADYEVETAGPDGTLEVPADALTWDVESKTWTPVPAGTTAVSKVTFDYSKYTDSVWHDGQPITMADAIYSIAQGAELAYDPEKVRIETALAVTSRPILETFKGYRLTDDGRLEVYVDYWHFDEDHIGAYASPVSFDMPWELKAAMDDLVFEQRRAAYSDTAASRFSVPWLSLVLERDAGLVDRTLRGPRARRVRARGRLRLRRPGAGHARRGGGPLRRRHRSGTTRRITWSSARDRSTCGSSTRRRSSPSWWPSVMSPTPSTPAISTVASRRCSRSARCRLTRSCPARTPSSAPSSTGPAPSGLQYLLLDPATTEVVVSGRADDAGDGTFAVTIPADVTRLALPGLLRALHRRRQRFARAHHRAPDRPRGAALALRATTLAARVEG